MTRTALILPLAMLAFSGTAFASDLDGETVATLATHVDAPELDATASRHGQSQSASRGSKSVTRTTATGRSGKQAQRTTYSNGNKSATVTRGRSTTSSSSSRYGSNGDRVHNTDTSTKLREQRTLTNGDKTATQRRGANFEQSQRQGVANGERFRENSGSANVRTAGKMTNEHGGSRAQATRTQVQHDSARSNGVKTLDRTRVAQSGRASTTRPLAQPGHAPGARPGHASPPPARRATVVTQRPSSGHRPTAVVRPSGGHRPTTVVRPGVRHTTVVRPSVRHTTVVRPSTRVVTYRTVRPYHGVFVYGPRPATHVYYQDSGPAQVANKHMPSRDIDRTNSVAIGLKTGSLLSGYYDGGAYGDLGVGLAGRYRPAESVGLQLDVTHHAQSWTVDTERSQTLAAGSVQLFAFPWTRVSPYAIGGVTYDARNIQDDIAHGNGSATVIANDALWGLHAGVGLELAMGKSLALDLEGRYIGYLDKSPTDPSIPGALQLTAGLMVHF